MGGRKKMGESFPQLGVKPCRLPGSQLPTGVDVVGRVMMLRLQKTEEKLWISVAYPGASPLNFDRGGGRIPTGGTDSGESKPPTPKFRFLLGFRQL